MNIVLRAPEPSDVDMLYRLENEADVRAVSWGHAPISRQMLWDYVNSYSADIYSDKQLRLIIMADGNAVGTVDITDFDPENCRAMIGVAIDSTSRGLGIANEAMSQAIEICRDDYGMHQLAVIVPKDNDASMRLFLSLGFKTSGCLRSWLRRGKTYVDAIVMQLLFR